MAWRKSAGLKLFKQDWFGAALLQRLEEALANGQSTEVVKEKYDAKRNQLEDRQLLRMCERKIHAFKKAFGQSLAGP